MYYPMETLLETGTFLILRNGQELHSDKRKEKNVSLCGGSKAEQLE